MKRLMNALMGLPQIVLMLVVNGYRFWLSPWLGSACRFEPSCSAYSLQALHQHGAVIGSYLTLRRVVRCHPWCDGGHDPVPAPGAISFFCRVPASAASIISEKTPS